MLDRKEISEIRRAELASYMKERGFSCLMFLNPGLGNWNQWLSDGMERGPGGGLVQFPFNRGSIYLVPQEGPIVKRCAVTAHPTDPNIFPELTYENVQDVVGDGPVGVVNLDAMKAVTRDILRTGSPKLELIDITRELDRIKAVKLPAEIEAARDAAAIMDRTFSVMPMLLRDGKLERDVAVALRERTSEIAVGSEDLNTTIALTLTSAPDGAAAAEEPMDYPGRRLSCGDRVNIVMNTYALQDTASVLGRSYILGKASKETKNYWSIALNAQSAAAKAAKPGATLREIEQFVQNTVYAPNGIPADKTDWIYGLGMYRCEAPRVKDDTAKMPLEEGMVLAIGPCITPDGKDPYCCMDPFLVTVNGAVRLTKTSQELRELGFFE